MAQFIISFTFCTALDMWVCRRVNFTPGISFFIHVFSRIGSKPVILFTLYFISLVRLYFGGQPVFAAITELLYHFTAENPASWVPSLEDSCSLALLVSLHTSCLRFWEGWRAQRDSLVGFPLPSARLRQFLHRVAHFVLQKVVVVALKHYFYCS